MECVEAKAFKTSLWRPDMIVKSSLLTNQHQQQQQQQVCSVFHEDEEEVFKSSLWGSTNNSFNGGLCGLTKDNGDETFVDDLLDFSNEETVIVKEEEEYETTEKNNNETEMMMMKAVFSPEKNNNSDSLKNDFASVFASELSVPTDDLADLEWLSHFVEDSFSEEFSQQQFNDGNPRVLAAPPKTENQNKTEPENKPPTQFLKTESIETTMGGGFLGFSPQPPPPQLHPQLQPLTTTTATSVPGKARSKRSRTGGRVWSLGGYSALTETSSSSTSSTSSTTSSSSSCLIFNNNNIPSPRPDCCYVSLRKPPPMRQKKQRVFVNDDDYGSSGGCGGGGGGGARAPAIRTQCSHCGVTKTPQWRTGPLGAKTLCNACGVRFKSGRLLPEYRPASSPTFSREVHSNSHRKVLEMRKKKEVGGEFSAPEPGFTPAVHSF